MQTAEGHRANYPHAASINIIRGRAGLGRLLQAFFPGAASTGLPTGSRTNDFTHLTSPSSSTGRMASPGAAQQQLHSSEPLRVPVSARAAVAQKAQRARSARVDGRRATPEPLRPQSSQPSLYGGFATSRSPLPGTSISNLHVVGLGPSKSTSSLPSSSTTSTTSRRAASPSIEAAATECRGTNVSVLLLLNNFCQF